MVKYGGHSRAAKRDGSTEDSWYAYTCWSCGNEVSGAVIAFPNSQEFGSATRWLWCPSCGEPAVSTSDGTVRPSSRYGPEVPGLPPDVQAAYDEARDCMSVSAYTGAELVCRKIILHVAVDKELPAKDKKDRAPTFTACIDYLEEKGYVTPPMRPWVDRIKDNGNESTHELEPPSPGRAKSTLEFTAQMLRNTYGMEHLAAEYGVDEAADPPPP